MSEPSRGWRTVCGHRPGHLTALTTGLTEEPLARAACMHRRANPPPTIQPRKERIAMSPNRPISLSNLSPGDGALVVDVRGEGAFRRRLLDMGFVNGTFVRVVKRAPLDDPIEYCIGGIHITLRRTEAEQILVHPHETPECRHRSARGRRRRRDGSGPSCDRDGLGPRRRDGSGRHRGRDQAGRRSTPSGSGQGPSSAGFWNRFRRRGEVKRDD